MSSLQEFFDNLNDRGITCMQDFKVNQIEAYNQISYYSRHGDMGFSFFSRQETKQAITTGKLHLCWGSYRDDEVEDIIIANAICDEAKACKLEVSWNGMEDSPIVVSNVERGFFRKLLQKDLEVIEID